MHNHIKCPGCGKEIQINETDYESISKQVRDIEFNKELDERVENSVKLAEAELEKEYNAKLNQKDIKLLELENQIKLKDSEKELAIKEVIINKDNEINTLNTKLTLEKESFENKLKIKDEEIEHYKDFKSRLSTKMVGESLEQHCSIEFNQLRPLFKNAVFEKDNAVVDNTKGDFIFRDFDNDGEEIVSIMFEMKNEMEETVAKHKNEDFFKKLDKDRKNKNCEYAVLVSLLEADNELYNRGIVDVSHCYEKMYVVRPQFFIPIITLIRSLAMNSLEYKKQLKTIQNQNIDISNFEEKLEKFKSDFQNNQKLADSHFEDAIGFIDNCIETLLKAKKEILAGKKQVSFANNKADDLTIRSLTFGNQEMAKRFKELKQTKEKEDK